MDTTIRMVIIRVVPVIIKMVVVMEMDLAPLQTIKMAVVRMLLEVFLVIMTSQCKILLVTTMVISTIITAFCDTFWKIIHLQAWRALPFLGGTRSPN